eukprot:scaffold1726_cov56-Phaeocystis_antarctica.AAC.4
MLLTAANWPSPRRTIPGSTALAMLTTVEGKACTREVRSRVRSRVRSPLWPTAEVVDVHHHDKVVVGEVLEVLWDGGAGRRDAHVHRPELLLAKLDRLRHLGGLAHISRLDTNLGAGRRREHGGARGIQLAARARDERHGGSACSALLGDLQPDALAAAGDEDVPATERARLAAREEAGEHRHWGLDHGGGGDEQPNKGLGEQERAEGEVHRERCCTSARTTGRVRQDSTARERDGECGRGWERADSRSYLRAPSRLTLLEDSA